MDENLDMALMEAKLWSMDERNSIGEAVVCQSSLEQERGEYSVYTEAHEAFVVAKFVDGERVDLIERSIH